MKALRVTSKSAPAWLEITPLSDKEFFDVRISENINETTKPRRKHGADNENTVENVTVFEHDLYTSAVIAGSYAEFIAEVIHVRYSADDETALVNKGIEDKTNPEYVEYRKFAEAVKVEARKYFEKE